MQLHQILLGPVTTEKSVRLQEDNMHTFMVHMDATKIDVLNAVKRFYGVMPTSVRIIRFPKKTRMIGRSQLMTKRQQGKKALVTLKSGDTIELVSVEKKTKKKSSEKTSQQSKK